MPHIKCFFKTKSKTPVICNYCKTKSKPMLLKCDYCKTKSKPMVNVIAENSSLNQC